MSLYVWFDEWKELFDHTADLSRVKSYKEGKGQANNPIPTDQIQKNNHQKKNKKMRIFKKIV